MAQIQVMYREQTPDRPHRLYAIHERTCVDDPEECDCAPLFFSPAAQA